MTISPHIDLDEIPHRPRPPTTTTYISKKSFSIDVLVDIPPGGLQGLRNEQPGVDAVLVELAHALPQYADAAEVHGAFFFSDHASFSKYRQTRGTRNHFGQTARSRPRNQSAIDQQSRIRYWFGGDESHGERHAIFPRFSGHLDYAAKAATCVFNSNSTGLM
jgi:hypothetical protein